MTSFICFLCMTIASVFGFILIGAMSTLAQVIFFVFVVFFLVSITNKKCEVKHFHKKPEREL